MYCGKDGLYAWSQTAWNQSNGWYWWLQKIQTLNTCIEYQRTFIDFISSVNATFWAKTDCCALPTALVAGNVIWLLVDWDDTKWKMPLCIFVSIVVQIYISGYFRHINLRKDRFTFRNSLWNKEFRCKIFNLSIHFSRLQLSSLVVWSIIYLVSKRHPFTQVHRNV